MGRFSHPVIVLMESIVGADTTIVGRYNKILQGIPSSRLLDNIDHACWCFQLQIKIKECSFLAGNCLPYNENKNGIIFIFQFPFLSSQKVMDLHRQTCPKARTQSHGSNSPLTRAHDRQVATASQFLLAVFLFRNAVSGSRRVFQRGTGCSDGSRLKWWDGDVSSRTNHTVVSWGNKI